MDAVPWIALQLCSGLSPIRRRRLLLRYGDAHAILAAPDAKLRSTGIEAAPLNWLRRPDPGAIRGCLAWLASENAHLVPFPDPRFPPLLREIDDPPAALFALGKAETLAEPQIAIAGSRAATPLGRSTAADFARALSRRGPCIASGLAEGNDAAAHEAALDCGGPTVAVCTNGLDRVYPRHHGNLARRIAASGALISENPPSIELQQWMFPRRNRIISGMAVGARVVEAAACSGALITARLAAKQRREAFAVPGSIYSPQARGCHALIRSGAKLVERPEDILEELTALLRAGEPDAPQDAPSAAEPEDLPLFGQLLQHGPQSIGELVRETGHAAAEVAATLTCLELEGRVHALPGGRFQRSRQGC